MSATGQDLRRSMSSPLFQYLAPAAAASSLSRLLTTPDSFSRYVATPI